MQHIMHMNKTIIILGPTAIGKTDISIKLAKILNAEIISSDSVQIYKHMDIGSAKPSKEEQKAVKHHLIDIKEPNETFSSGEFVEKVNEILRKLKEKRTNAIIVGGGGFYIDSLVFGLDKIEPIDEKVKIFFDDICEEFSSRYLYNFLKIIDEKWANKIAQNDCQRIKRGLSVYISSKKEISSFFSNDKKIDDRFLIFVLYASREFINKRIEKRVDLMLEKGLIEEVRRLVEMGYADTNALKSIGYKETLQYLSKELDKNKLSDLIKKNTKAYAKRQLTLLKSRFKNNAIWIDIEKEDGLQAILSACKPYL